VAGLLERADASLAVELVPIRTSGDEHGGRTAEAADRGPRAPDDKSRFVREIEHALLGGKVDLAVHSAKDVPGDLPAGLAIVGVPVRADPRDALLGAERLADLPEGAAVGTGSLRRRAQLLASRPDLEVGELRGNVDTRLGRLDSGDFDAIVLARAGLARLGEDRGAPIAPRSMTPAPGQGCLLLEARANDRDVAERCGAVTDRESAQRLTAERALVAALDATCRTPIGAHAELVGDELTLSTFVGLPDGATWIRDSLGGTADDPGALGRAAAERLEAAGAAELLAEAERMAGEPGDG
jgi:hydroxymethylbilane synthase